MNDNFQLDSEFYIFYLAAKLQIVISKLRREMKLELETWPETIKI